MERTKDVRKVENVASTQSVLPPKCKLCGRPPHPDSGGHSFVPESESPFPLSTQSDESIKMVADLLGWKRTYRMGQEWHHAEETISHQDLQSRLSALAAANKEKEGEDTKRLRWIVYHCTDDLFKELPDDLGLAREAVDQWRRRTGDVRATGDGNNDLGNEGPKPQ